MWELNRERCEGDDSRDLLKCDNRVYEKKINTPNGHNICVHRFRAEKLHPAVRCFRCGTSNVPTETEILTNASKAYNIIFAEVCSKKRCARSKSHTHPIYGKNARKIYSEGAAQSRGLPARDYNNGFLSSFNEPRTSCSTLAE